MIIELKKFGDILLSRPAGREAFDAIRPNINPDEEVKVSFEGVSVATPSWVDEFITHLGKYVEGKVEVLPTQNVSVLATLRILVEAGNEPSASIASQFLKKVESSRAGGG
ncbi:MAG: DUF4325 domain-containing protein [Patescibacteria group bacterium]|nr:DUF4325 domain-containing protein [Patescibacteria group bacterium]